MIAALALVAAVAYPPSGTYHYNLSVNGTQYLTSTLLVTSTPKGLSVSESASLPAKGVTITATSVYDASSLAQTGYSGDIHTVNGTQHVDASFEPGTITLSSEGSSAAVKADPKAPIEMIADNFPGTMIAIPAMLHANHARAYTIATLNGAAIVATASGDVHPTRPKSVPGHDVSLVLDTVSLREIYWYDPKTFVVDELDIPSQSARLILTGSSASTAPLATSNAEPTPKPKFPEEAMTVPIVGGHLSGTIELPNGKGPFPIALIIAGSGPTDRNGNSYGIATGSYAKLADGLAAQGIATLRYDKRGIGLSSIRQTERELRFDDFVTDALTLTAQLERDPRFSSVSLIGHSEGSLIGILTAQRDPKVREFVSLEGAGRTMGTIIDEQARAAYPADTAKKIARIDASLAAGTTVPDPGAELDPLFRPSVQPYLISEYKYDPAVELAKLTIPVLIVHGTTDLQVTLTDAKVLAAAYPHAQFVLIGGMNHPLVDAPLDRAANMATYNDASLPLNAKLAPVIAHFLLNAK